VAVSTDCFARFGAGVLLAASVLFAGCDPGCESTCRKVLSCEELTSSRIALGECTEECVRQGELYQDWQDQEKIDAFQAHKRCLGSSTCEEISVGVCHDDEIFIF